MNKRSIPLGVCVSSLLIGLLTQSPDSIALAQGDLENESPATSSATEKSDLKLCDIARAITVKVIAGGSWGSGILVQRQERRNTTLYTVLTNAHVLLGNSYQIQTPDGKIYRAKRLVEFDGNNTGGDDLAILQFDSQQDYQRAIWAPLNSLRERQKVFAAGFPVNTTPYPNIEATGGIVCLWPGGIISLILDRPMQEGYQIGYHIDIAQGMSGGPLLNEQGEVIGVNGKGDPVIFSNPDIYRYQDDNTRVQQPLSVMTSSSWAIPIETFVQQAPASLELNQGQLANSQSDGTRQTPPPVQQQSSPNGGVTANDLSQGRIDNHQASPNPQTQAANPPTQDTPILSESEIKNRAEKITVLVNYNNKLSPNKIIPLGAGVLVAQQETTYYALTHESVIPADYYQDRDSMFSVGDNQQRYELNNIRRAGRGLVLLQFTSNHNDEVALVGDATDLEENSNVYIAGWNMGQGKSWEFLFTKGEIISQRNLPTDYVVAYKNQIRGMKGGPVLDEKGMLVAIHKGEEGGTEGIAIDSLQVSLPEFYSLLTRQGASITSEPRNIPPQLKPWTNPPQQQLPTCSETLWGYCSE